jgi:hypothetical protein
MSISTYFKPNIHQNSPEILGVKNKCSRFYIFIFAMNNDIWCF